MTSKWLGEEQHGKGICLETEHRGSETGEREKTKRTRINSI
jgi:hypothetical protein